MGPGEFPWRPGHAHAHTDRKAWSSAQVHSKNIGGPVALLPTDQCSRPKIPEPPCRVTAGWGWRARRWPRGAGRPRPEDFASPAPLGRAGPVHSATLWAGDSPRPQPRPMVLRIPPGPTSPPRRRCTRGWRGGHSPAPYANTRGAGGGRLPAADKSPGRGAAPKPLPPGSRPSVPSPRLPAARPRPPAPGKDARRGRGRGATGAAPQARLPGSPLPTCAVPGRVFSVGTREPAPPRRPPGAGQVASPQLLRVGPVCREAISRRDPEELRWQCAGSGGTKGVSAWREVGGNQRASRTGL